MRHALAFVLLTVAAPTASAADANLLSLEELLKTYRSEAPVQPEPEVLLDGWIEKRADGAREVVIVLEPAGETKLNADPGITVTHTPGDRIHWQVPMPHRHQDRSIDYFEPRATVRMPFEGEVAGPIVVLVEFAYCVVDFQCFFGEEELTLAAVD